MKTQKSWAPGAKIKVSGVELGTDRWVVEAETQGQPTCPSCHTLSDSRHSSYLRRLQDLPVQGVPVMIRLRSRRWRCRNSACVRKIFTERLPGVASPLARRSSRVIELVWLIGHSAGGRPGERLMERFAMPASDDTILRHLNRGAKNGRWHLLCGRLALMTGLGEKDRTTARSLWTWSVGPWRIFWRIDAPRAQRRGWPSIPPLKLSAATGVACMRQPPALALPRSGKPPTASISSKISARRSRSSLAGFPGQFA